MYKQLSDFNLGDLFSLFIILYRFSTLDLLPPLPTFKNPCTATITSNLNSIIQYKLHNLLKLLLTGNSFSPSSFLGISHSHKPKKKLGMHRSVSRTKIKKKQGNVSPSLTGHQCTITLIKYPGEIEKVN